MLVLVGEQDQVPGGHIDPDAAGCAIDQYAAALTDMGGLHQGLPCGHPGQGYGRGLDMVALRTMNGRELHTPKPVARRRGELRSALRYVRGTPELLIPLLMMAVVGTISFNFQVLLPLLADFT